MPDLELRRVRRAEQISEISALDLVLGRVHIRPTESILGRRSPY